MPYFTASVSFRRHQAQPYPSRAALLILFAELEQTLERAGMRPVALKCQAWAPGTHEHLVGTDAAHDHVARLTIEAEPGELPVSLACWYQWQHPRWEWARPELSVVDSGGPAQAAVTDAMAVAP